MQKGMVFVKECDLVMLMYENEPLETFEKLLNEDIPEEEWNELFRKCCIEESYESVGGDYGDEDDPPINHKRLAYLSKLIAFLKEKGFGGEKSRT